MMLFKLSLKNMKKSFKDYTIYFLTLILGVAIFYVFNSIDSQQAMLELSDSQYQIIDLMISILSGFSVFVSFVLGFLIIYANKFLIKRRKKEFGIYMTLGMSKGKISKILFLETLLIGVLSLFVGLVLGVFLSQMMSVLVAKMFEADMSTYQFIFSTSAMWKTIIYFGVMYILVMIFNVISVSKCKLIDLINAKKRTEKVKIKNTFLSILLFLLSLFILGYDYYLVTEKLSTLSGREFIACIIVGILATILFFFSLSGFLLKLIQSRKKTYFKGLNMFVVRQINSQINTAVFSMSIICILLFFTICISSTAVSINNSYKKDLDKLTPVDLNIVKNTEYYDNNGNLIKNDDDKIVDDLKEYGFDVENSFTDQVQITGYYEPSITYKSTLGKYADQLEDLQRSFLFNETELILTESDYNKIAQLYGNELVNLDENKYAIVANFDQMITYHNKALKDNNVIVIGNKKYYPQSDECLYGFVEISNSEMSLGIIIVPDEAKNDLTVQSYLLAANYQGNSRQDKQEVEDKISSLDTNHSLGSITKIELYDSSIGLGMIVTFIGLYLGIIFLICGAAILALKELSESSDNKERYNVLRNIGADQKMLNKALFIQIAVFFGFPLFLAIIHSIFGIKVANLMLVNFANQSLLTSIILTAIFIIIIYGGYFIATYLCSKNIIKETIKKS